MLRRGLRHDAVAEIEYERTAAQEIKDLLYAPLEMYAAGDQEQRIEIALNGQPALRGLADVPEPHGGVAADGIDLGFLHVAFGRGAAPTREADDGDIRISSLHARHDG